MAAKKAALERVDDGSGTVLVASSYIALPPLQIVPIQKTKSAFLFFYLFKIIIFFKNKIK